VTFQRTPYVFALGVLAVAAAGLTDAFRAVAQEPETREAKPTPILNMSGQWRAFYVYRGPYVRDGEQLTQVGTEVDTLGPPENWTEPDFDDSAWHRLRGQPFQPLWGTWGTPCYKANAGFIGTDHSTAFQALICLRGKFNVTDPAQAKDLTLSVEYRGGVVLYLNGHELARGDMTDGKIDTGTLARDYPLNVFFGEDGQPLEGDHRMKDPKKVEPWLRIKRRITDVEVPARLLRKGVNVLAVAAHRAPYPKAFVDKVSAISHPTPRTACMRSTCGITGLLLTSPDGKGIEPNMVRPKGVQVWNVSVLEGSVYDFGNPCELLRPVVIAGCRNGGFSGKVMVGSTDPIRKLDVRTGALVDARTKAVIPASSVRLLFGEGPAPPEEIPVSVRKSMRGVWPYPDQPEEVYGAVMPVLVTVYVPKDTRPGDYEGRLTITMEGADPVELPLKLSVADFTLPGPEDWETVVDMIQSPDTLALHYRVPLWSKRHWELIDHSFRLLGTAGLDTVYVPMISETHFGNEQTMIRWVPKGDGTYDYDFSIVEKYMDLFEKHCGKPRIVCLYVWDMSLEGGTNWRLNLAYRSEEIKKAREANAGLGPQVTAFDPATNKVERLQLPAYSEKESRAPWGGLYARFREILKARGLYDRTMLGICLDPKPTKEVVELFKELMPGRPWLVQDHIYRKDERIHGVPVGYQANVFLRFFTGDDLRKSHYGTVHPEIRLWFPRAYLARVLPHNFRVLAEKTIIGGYHGFGRLGGDFWKVFEGDRTGRKYGGLITYRYPKNASGALSMRTGFLAPGKNGAQTTLRFELLREGVQETEARIFVEKALLEKRIKGELATRCEEMLLRRNEAVLVGSYGKVLTPHRQKWWETSTGQYANTSQAGWQWYLASGFEARTRKLFELAAEVARSIGTAQ